MVMTNKTRPRIASALLAGAVAVVPLAATVALAPSAAAIEVVEGEQPGFDADALADKGIAPASLDLEDDAAESASDVEFVDEDGTVVERDDVTSVDRSELNRRGIDPLSEDTDAEPVSLEIMPISATIDEGLPTGAIVAIVAGGAAVLGTGAGFAVRARKAKVEA
jgi:hypothetical protein